MLDSKTLADNLTRVIVNPLIALFFAAGLVLFVWGIIEFLVSSSGSGDVGKKEDGKRHMLWGILGMFVMAASYTIIKLIDNSVGSNFVY